MFVNSIRQNFFGGTSAGIYVSMLNVNVPAATSNINVNIPSTQYFNYGMLRVKSSAGMTGTVRIQGIWAADGNASNTTNLFAGESAPATSPMDHTFPYLITEIKANQVIVMVLAGTAGQVDIEFAGV